MKKLFTFGLTVFAACFMADAQLPSTVLLRDIRPGMDGSVQALDMRSRVFNGRLLFTAYDTVLNDRLLWSSDGTEAGTKILSRDIVPNTYTDDTSSYVEFKGRLYFFDRSGERVFSTDGVPGNGVTELLNGTNSMYDGRRFIVYNNELYFIAQPLNASQYYLYKTDGTNAGTVKVSTSILADQSSLMAIMGGKLYFAGSNGSGAGIAVTDGTSAGTSIVGGMFFGNMRYLTTFGNMLLFSGEGPGNLGRELWKTDGTNAGTVMLKDINPGAGSSDPADFQILNNKVYFRGSDVDYNYEIWSTDGTTAGTTKLTEIDPTPGNGGLRSPLIPVNGKLLFIGSTPATGWELFATDGTAAGTGIFKEFRSGNSDGIENLDIQNVRGGKLYFAAKGRTFTSDAYVTDGTISGTDYLSNDSTKLNVDALCGFHLMNNRIYYAGGRQPAGSEVYSVTATSTSQNIARVPAQTLSIYPNPTNGMLHIASALQNQEVQVYDALGRKVLQGRIANNSINLSALDNGFYIIVMEKAGQRSIGRVQVQH